jgi:5-formyltetrahydrofolate cyclo-ligase
MTKREEKNQLRRLLLEQMRALPPAYCLKADEAIYRHVAALPAYQTARTIGVYVGMAHEIDTKPLIKRMLAEGKRVGVPLCVGKGVMEMREIGGLDELQAGTWGILEPAPDAPLLQPDEIDLGLIPCVSGNEEGQRLGYGGGFYDAYLAKAPFLRVLLCRKAMMTAPIPVEPHDAMMDVVVSEDGAVYCSSHKNFEEIFH